MSSDVFRVDPSRFLAHVRMLASDELGGRGNGTPGLARAADYIRSEFERARLQPGGDSGSYFQAFDASAHLDEAESTLVFRTPAAQVSFRAGLHYYLLSTPDPSATSHAGAPSRETIALVFAGFGITAPGLDYDDYAGLDVQGKAVIVFTHEPQENDPLSVFEGRALTPFSDIGNKADAASKRGARLLILVEDPSHVEDRASTPAWTRDPQIGSYVIPVMRVDRARLDRLLTSIDLHSVAREIDLTLTPQSQSLTGVSLSYPDPVAAVSPRLQNVVGVLKGSDPSLAAEAIVIGAHYDHLGLGARFSRSPAGTRQIHNGADDNASGTAMVIEMANVAMKHPDRFKRSIVFVTFAGEELGLVGSRHYVQNAPISVRKTVAMVNLDMVGRARGRVMVGGTERYLRFARLITAMKRETPLRLDDFRNGYADGASDSDSFQRERVPTLMFFTGFHDDYHQPTDDWELIDAPGAAEIARLVLGVVERLAG